MNKEVDSMIADLSGLSGEERSYALASILSRLEEQTEQLHSLAAAMEEKLEAEAYGQHDRFEAGEAKPPQSWAQWCGHCTTLGELWGRLSWLIKRCARADLPPYDYDTATTIYERERR